MKDEFDICVIGGFGHVGLPLSIAFADAGKRVCAFDIAKDKIDILKKGKMPFMEEGGDAKLDKVVKSGMLKPSLSPDDITKSTNVIIVIGTPTDTHLSPEFESMKAFLGQYMRHFKDGQLLILRSTVYPGTTDMISRTLAENGKRIDVSFCPERIAEGYALKEIYELPQIVSGTTPEAEKRAKELFSAIAKEILVLKPMEAEVAKLLTNSWRYIKFSVANQFLMICNDTGLDFYKIYDALTYNYPRAKDMPRAGFASGPCLFKDTVQLSAFNNHGFPVGNSAMLINEGLPFYVIGKLKEKHNLKSKTIGILGMAFKAGSDDRRDSLSYKLKTLLEFEAKKTLCSDVYINEQGFVSAQELADKSDIIIVATPHREYKNLKIKDGKIVVDVWNFYGKGCII
ncbi:MAG: nucleotide sugar dehydrogenase [Candidatus Micrarchaeota archaeon]|nr:nucleotide sugar dehydrogenase [Candidatus Micrarchaeota archaeon]